MLKKKLRLRKNEEIMKVFRLGKPFFVSSLGCKALKTTDNDTRIGFSVPKKLFPKAVERNRVKRVLRNAVRKNLDVVPKGYDIVFFFQKKQEKTDFLEIAGNIRSLLEKIK